MAVSLDVIESLGKENEGVFSRDEDGNLIRQVKATYAQLNDFIKIVIDGVDVSMPLATKVRDAQGVERYNLDGLPIIRKTTIYDVGMKLVRDGVWSQDDLTCATELI